MALNRVSCRPNSFTLSPHNPLTEGSSAPQIGYTPKIATEPPRLPIAPAILDERFALELLEGDSQLFLGVHHDGTVPGNGLADRLSRDEQEPHAVRLGGDGDLVAVAEAHQVTVPDQAFACHVEVVPAHDFVAVGV